MLDAIATIWLGWTAVMAAGEWHHRRKSRSIKHRILISGMRGKSTAVRLLHSGFTAANRRVLGRITGDSPVHLYPDGNEKPIRRWGTANIREMRRSTRLAAALDCEIICFENMAIRPELSKLVSTHVTQPTVILYCFDGLDHTEYFPPDPRRRARETVKTWPLGTRIIIATSERNRFIIDEAHQHGHQVALAPPLLSHELRPYMQSLCGAVKGVLEFCGVESNLEDPMTSAASRLQGIPAYQLGHRTVIDLRSANDPDSVKEQLELLLGGGRLNSRPQIAYFHRADRPGRLMAFTPLLHDSQAMIGGDQVPWTYRQEHSLKVQPNVRALLQSDTFPLVLIGNRHSSSESEIESILRGATVESW